VGGYARIRKQFKVPIAEMEGVQEALGRIGGNAYIMQSAQLLTNAMLNHHEQPSVISAIMKQQMTTRMRSVSFYFSYLCPRALYGATIF
jgi:acyl-CoA dehydrogenase